MDIGRFNQILGGLINSNSIKSKDLGKSGPAAAAGSNGGVNVNSASVGDSLEINFGKLAEIQANPTGANANVAQIVNDVSKLSPEEAKAKLNPDVVKQLVAGGVLE